MKKTRAKQAAIIGEIEERVNQMPESSEHGFAYAVNLALSRHFNLPPPALPGERISEAVKNTDRKLKSKAGSAGASARWQKS